MSEILKNSLTRRVNLGLAILQPNRRKLKV